MHLIFLRYEEIWKEGYEMIWTAFDPPYDSSTPVTHIEMSDKQGSSHFLRFVGRTTYLRLCPVGRGVDGEWDPRLAFRYVCSESSEESACGVMH